MGTFITVPRSIFDDGLFVQESFSRREAFLDLVQRATHEPRLMPTRGGGTVVLERGQLSASIRFLASRWGWSAGKVEGVLKEYESVHLIERKTDNATTFISIVNYDLYQKPLNDDEHADRYAERDNNKEDKEVKNNKPSYSESVGRIYALYPSSTKRIEGNTVALKSAKKNKAHIERMLRSGEHTEESLTYAIKRYLDETRPEYIKCFETFLNQVPDYSQSPNDAHTSDGDKPTKEEAMRKAMNPSKEERLDFYNSRFKIQHPAIDGETAEQYRERVRTMWEMELKAWIGRRVDAVNNSY